MLFPT